MALEGSGREMSFGEFGRASLGAGAPRMLVAAKESAESFGLSEVADAGVFRSLVTFRGE